MPEILSELVAKITADASELKSGLATADKAVEKAGTGIKKNVEAIKKAISGISTAWAGVGVAIIGSMGLMAKSAAEEEAGIGRLRIALRNIGTSYDNVKDSLEGVISATQRKTGIADSEQRDTLGRLLLVTNDYNKALSLLPLTLDLAAAGQMDASTAATYLGKAMLELANGADKVTIRLGQASIQVGSLEEIMERVKGAAEAARNPFVALGNEISDLGEAIGKVLLPIVKDLGKEFEGIVDTTLAWIDTNPELIKAIMAGSLAVSGMITAVFALKAAIILLGGTANLIFGGILIAVGAITTAVVLLLQGFKELGDTDKEFREMSEAVRAELIKLQDAIVAGYGKERQAAQDTYDAAIKAIREEYGVYETTAKSKMDLAKDASEANRRALQDELKQARQVHDEKISLLEKEYSQKIRTLNAESNYQISAIQDQIDAIDNQTRQEDLTRTRAAEARRLRELKSNIDSAGSAEDAAVASAAYSRYASEIAQNELLRSRDAEKDALRAQIEDIRSRTQEQTNTWQTELESQRIALDTEYNNFETNQEKIIGLLDNALELELKRLDAVRIKKEEEAKSSLDLIVETLAEEERLIQVSFDNKLEKARVYKADLDAILGAVKQGVTVPYEYTEPIFENPMLIPKPAPAPYLPGEKKKETYIGEYEGTPPGFWSFLKGYEQGGIVEQTGLAYLHVGEKVTPANESTASVVVNFTQPVFFDREDSMNKFVDMIRKGIQRQDRLRFGGAWNGR